MFAAKDPDRTIFVAVMPPDNEILLSNTLVFVNLPVKDKDVKVPTLVTSGKAEFREIIFPLYVNPEATVKMKESTYALFDASELIIGVATPCTIRPENEAKFVKVKDERVCVGFIETTCPEAPSKPVPRAELDIPISLFWL